MRAARLCATAAVCALAMVAEAGAQSIGYGELGEVGGADGPATDAPTFDSASGGKRPRGNRNGEGRGGRKLRVAPYIEANQIVGVQISPGDEVLTYTQVAAGVDAAVVGRNNAAAASIRYEHHFGWGRNAGNGDSISGLINGYTTIAPGLTLEAGGLATRATGDGRGALGGIGPVRGGSATIYSAYAGPSFATRTGDLSVSANYRAGYTKVDGAGRGGRRPVGAFVDTFDHSLVQIADAQVGTQPGAGGIPVGLAAAGSFYQEDISNLDQRVRDMQARGIVTVEVDPTLRLTGAVGYEDVTISARDAVRDAAGAPVISGGRYVTDKSAPRLIAYDVEGLIWDAGVMWRPSRRTALNANIGRRYGSTSFRGSFYYAPNDRSTLSLAVYDNVAGFGGRIARVLDDLPDDFQAVRDPVSGDLRGCVSSLEGSNCFSGVLGSLRSSTFRARGVSASYTVRLGRALDAGIGLGYDRRKFIGARGTVLAGADGVVDENLWLSTFVAGRLDRRSGWSANGYAQWLASNDSLVGDSTRLGASASYYRLLTDRLRASAAIGLDGLLREAPFEDIWAASALLGVRYSF